MREIIDRLERTCPEQTQIARLKEIELLLRDSDSGGLAALSATCRVQVLHALCEHVLAEDKDIWKRMEPSEIEASRATVLGRDGAGKWIYAMPALESRVYSICSPWKLSMVHVATRSVALLRLRSSCRTARTWPTYGVRMAIWEAA